MVNLEAKVLEPLKLSDKGVDQYMKVNYAQGQLLVLPSPSYSGIYAQATAKVGVDVLVEKVGTLGDTTWGVLLDAHGKQYGSKMDYSKRAMERSNQVVYIADSQRFRRGSWTPAGEMKKRSIDVYVFGQQISLRYSNLFTDDKVPKALLEEFQGFIVCMANGTYRPWMLLNVPNLKAAAKNSNYNNLRSLISEKAYVFVSASDSVDLSFLEQRAASDSKGGILSKIGGLFSRKGKGAAEEKPVSPPAEKKKASAQVSLAPPASTASKVAPPAAEKASAFQPPQTAGDKEGKGTARATVVSDAYLILNSGGRVSEIPVKPGQQTIEQLLTGINMRALQGKDQGVIGDYRGHMKRDNPFTFGVASAEAGATAPTYAKDASVNVEGGRRYALNLAKPAPAASKPALQPASSSAESKPADTEPAPKAVVEPARQEPKKEEPKLEELATIILTHEGKSLTANVPAGDYRFEQLLQKLPIDLKSEKDKDVLKAYIDHMVASGTYLFKTVVKNVPLEFGSKVGSTLKLLAGETYNLFMNPLSPSTAVAPYAPKSEPKKAPEVALANVDPNKTETEIIYVLGLQAGGMGTAPWKVTVTQADVQKGMTLGDILNNSDKYTRTREERQARDLVMAETQSGNYTLTIGGEKYNLATPLKNIFAKAEYATVNVEDKAKQEQQQHPAPHEEKPVKKIGKGRGEDRKKPEPPPQPREERMYEGKVSGSTRPG